jgi:DNA-binding NarL/FixJ family response regulator
MPSTHPIIKLALVEDHVLVRKGIIQLLKNAPDQFQVTIEAGNCDELIDQLPPHSKDHPDIVITDIRMPGNDGFETAQWLKLHHPHIKVVILTMFDDERSVLRMTKLGVDGYLTKNMNPDELLNSLLSVRDKGYFYSDFVTETLIHSVRNEKVLSASDIWLTLSEREKAFVKHACSEKTYNEIAGEMSLSAKTIDGYRDNIFTRFNVKSRVGLVIYAIKHEIISLSALA